MNPQRLRAGKAVEPTGQSPVRPGTSASGESPSKDQAQIESPPPIPQILFEGDEPSPTQDTGLSQKFELGATGEAKRPELEEPRLPEAYGTARLILAASDPHTLYAHWDLSPAQQRHYSSLSEEGSLVLRAYAHAFSNQPAIELRAQPQSQHLFVHVERAGTSYVGELGYYQPDRQWKTIATSAPAIAPVEGPSQDTTVIFSTLPSATKLQEPEKSSQDKEQPTVIPVPAPAWPFDPETQPTIEPSRAAGLPPTPTALPAEPPPFVKRGLGEPWTPAQEQLLAEMVRTSSERREWISSAEIVEFVHHEFELRQPFGPSELTWPILPGAFVNISSPAGGAELPVHKGFWFNVNAELVIYGATEPNAQVTLGGRPIKLRSDGTFSCHFALPDGRFALAAVAISGDGQMRQAAMSFSRHTDYLGAVGAHVQNPLLEPMPQAE